MKCPLKEDNFGRMPDCQPDCAWMVNGACAVAVKHMDANGGNVSLEPAPLISGYDEFLSESCRQDADQPKRQESLDCESDSHEKLEADVRRFVRSLPTTDDERRYGEVIDLLNRQAYITQDETIHTYNLAAREARKVQEERISELTEQVSTITEFRDRWRSRWTERNAEYDELLDEYDKLKAELDEWKEKAEARSQGWAKANIGWAEANAEAERWRQRCARMQGNRGGQCEDDAREIAAERDYWKQEVALCMQSAYPPSHSPERAYNPDVMAYPDRHGCTTPSTLVSAVIDGLRDEKADEYMKLLDEVTKLSDDLKACQGQLKTERNNFVQMQGARDYWRDKLAMVLRRLKELGCEVGGLHDVPIGVELPPRDEGLA